MNTPLTIALSVLLAATLCSQESSDAPALPAERTLAVSGQGYFPVALRLQDGRIAVVLRGGGPHLSILGKLDMIFSSDEGKTWTPPITVVDSEQDDRNPALGQAKDGTLVVGYWKIATYTDEGKYDPKLDKPRSTWTVRSRDGGKTWEEPLAMEVSDIGIGSPFGRMVTLADGAMLMAVYGFEVRPSGQKTEGDRNHSYIYKSTDNGRTWKRISEIGDGKQQLNETALLQLPDGTIRAALRTRSTELWLSDSRDLGATWSPTRKLTPANTHPGDLCLLNDGRILLTAGDRVGPAFGVLGMVSGADGEFAWDRRFALVTDARSADCGYPTSIVTKDGGVITVYYATRVTGKPEWGTHAGVVHYKAPAP